MKANLTNDLTKLFAWYLTHWNNKLVRFSHKNIFISFRISGCNIIVGIITRARSLFIKKYLIIV